MAKLWPLAVEQICRMYGHHKVPVIEPDGSTVQVRCLVCKAYLPLPSPKVVLHLDRAEVGQDCVNLSECEKTAHTYEWPCDFA